MRKHVLLALWLCAAASQGLVSGAEAERAQTAGRAAQATGKQASAQNAPANRPPAIPAGFRLLSLKEGRALVQRMAWADDEEGLAPDCSHLVHTLYQQAGYLYPYASSLDLYRGTGQFWRVPYAQPGDLVVWRGHVGIVVDPKEHSFFSSVTSGTRIQNYHSAYWQARGYPRFYRYLTKSPLKGSGTSEVADQPLRQQPNEQSVIGSAENRPSLQTVKTSPAPAGGALGKPRNAITAAHAENSSQPSPSQAPLQILLRTSEKQPKASDVTSALQVANLEAGELLRAGNLEQLERPVVVYRQLQVSGVELKGKRGTAQIQMETVATLTGQRMESQPGWEDHELELERTKKGWVMVQGNEIAYVPIDGAMRILAARLAALTQSTERSTQKDREQAHIVRFMSLLVE